ncbi:helix-turn-helix domain-containing protein [Bacillus velezensis]|uniref:helix-turn-helix domain-containing protein n=1 Tax=Bacillus velezensis TaxID=492670 RepID=UPI0013D5C3CA|nr:helix-turn-helix domain-containing protein [Bacillus velezensis]
MLGDRLKVLREKKDLTQDGVAKALDISRGTYAHYEINKRRPDYETLIKIADFFDVSIDYLLRGEDHYRNKAKEISKNNDVRFDILKGREFTENEKEEFLADALRRLDGIEKMIAENFKNKKEEK